MSEPTPTELIHQLHEALWGERSPARNAPPKLVWEELLAEVRHRREVLRPFADAADRCDAERPGICTLNPEHGCTTFSYRTLDVARAALEGDPR